jgi:hypothetical protein
MQRQDEITMTLDKVAEQQKRHIWRDRVVGALFALGLMVGAVAIESQARTVNAANHSPTQSAPVKVAVVVGQ